MGGGSLARTTLASCLIVVFQFLSPTCAELRAYYNLNDYGSNCAGAPSSTGSSSYCNISLGDITGQGSVSTDSRSNFGTTGVITSDSQAFVTPPFSVNSQRSPIEADYGKFSFGMWISLNLPSPGCDGKAYPNLLQKVSSGGTIIDLYFEDYHPPGWCGCVFCGSEDSNPLKFHAIVATTAGVIDVEFASVYSHNSNWNHVMITYDKSYLRLYINGNLAGSSAANGGAFLDDGLQPYIIGNGFDSTGSLIYELDGQFDEVMFFDSALPQSEISAYYNSGRSLSDSFSLNILRNGATATTTTPQGLSLFGVTAGVRSTFEVDIIQSGQVLDTTTKYSWETTLGDCAGTDVLVGGTEPSISVSSAEVGDVFLHTDVLFNYLCARQTAVMRVTPSTPTVTVGLDSNVTVVIGAETRLSVAVTGVPLPFVQWQELVGFGNSSKRSYDERREKSSILGRRQGNATARWIPIPGANGPTYSFVPSADDTGRVIRAFVYNLYGDETATNLTTITAIPDLSSDGGGSSEEDGDVSEGGKDNKSNSPLSGALGGTFGGLLFCLVCVAVPCCLILSVCALVVLSSSLFGTVKSQQTISRKLDTIKASWEIDFEELEVNEELGSGGFGTVYRGMYRECDVAVKQMNEAAYDRKQFKAEAALMKGMPAHVNVIRLYGVCTAPETPMCLVTEYMPGGDLLNYLQMHGRPIDEVLHRWAVDIAAGMVHLSQEGIIHRDLAARNLLLTSDLTIKVADFGMSRKVDKSGHGISESNVGPLKWMSPELLKDGLYSEKSDVYAFGIAVYEVLSGGRSPYPGIDAVEAARAVINDGQRPSIPADTSDVLVFILKWCWAADPKDRPSFKELLAKMNREFKGNILHRSVRMSRGLSIGFNQAPISSFDGSAVSYGSLYGPN